MQKSSAQLQNSPISKSTEMSEMINVYKTASSGPRGADNGYSASDSSIIQAIADVDDLFAVHAIKC